MTVTRNRVTDGTGILAVECTVRAGGETSDWRKITDLSARPR